MKILITGGTGFIGRRLIERLKSENDRIVVLSRTPDAAQEKLGYDVEVIGLDQVDAWSAVMPSVEAIVNLAGEPILPGRWSASRKAVLRESRVDLTRRIVETISRTPVSRRPRVLLSASAIGFYGDGGDAILEEGSPRGGGFLAELCEDWERAALDAQEHKVRVGLLRIGIVLGKDGGALEKMVPPFRLGLGGVIGSGRQYVSWIHIDDLVSAIVEALHDERYKGPVNLTAPSPVTHAELCRSLGSVLHRPVLFPVPRFALRLALGEASEALLEGQRVMPTRLGQLGFHHRFTELRPALEAILGPR